MREGITRSDSPSSNSHSFVSVKILGSLGNKEARNGINIELDGAFTKLGALMEVLQAKCELQLRRDSTLVMVNGIEARALDDLDTTIRTGDEVVFVPMFHGG